MVKEIKLFYKVEIIISVNSINLDNIEIVFNKLVLHSDDADETIEISNRRIYVEKNRCSDGIRATIYIVNDGTDIKDRIDYLVDEDYEIIELNFDVTQLSTGGKLQYTQNKFIGEQLEKEVEVEMDPKLKNSVDYINSNLTEGNEVLASLVYATIEANEDLNELINLVNKINLD